MPLTPEEITADYRTAFDDVGEDVIFRRYSGTGASRPSVEITRRSRITGYAPAELAGNIRQGDQKLIVFADGIEDSGFSDGFNDGFGGDWGSLMPGDKAVVRGRELNIEAVDGNTRRVQGVLIAYEIQVRG